MAPQHLRLVERIGAGGPDPPDAELAGNREQKTVVLTGCRRSYDGNLGAFSTVDRITRRVWP